MVENIILGIDNPFIANHKVYDKNILPGLAYIDIIYQVLNENDLDYKGYKLCDFMIFKPMVASENEIAVNIIENEDDSFDIVINSAIDKDELYVKARLIKNELHTSNKINITEYSFNEENDFEKAYSYCRSRKLVHTGILKADGRWFEDSEKYVLNISSSDPDNTNYLFNPTILDCSTVITGYLVSGEMKEKDLLYLPLSCKSFIPLSDITDFSIAVIDKERIKLVNDICSFDISFYDNEGNLQAELQSFTIKFVRDVEKVLFSEKNLMNYSSKKTTRNNKDVTSLTKESIGMFLKGIFAKYLNKDVDSISESSGFYEMGLESAMLLSIVEEIKDYYSMSLSPTLLFEYTTIEALKEYICNELGIKEEEADLFDDSLIEDKITLNKSDKNINSDTIITNASNFEEDDIAIIGMSCRFPKSDNVNEFWENLKNGCDCITEIPESRWDYKKYLNIKSPSGKSISKWGGFINDYDTFDAQFFRVSGRDAEITDPQERKFLEVCWEAIEDSGYTPKNIVKESGINKRRNVGVFVGVMHKDYTICQANELSDDNLFSMSLSYAPIANRVSYFCNFNGPSIAVDTVCSSSLTALHLAVQSIRSGESEIAITGGVNLSLSPCKYISYGLMDMHSSEGKCRSFGEGGDGYVSADGVGAIILKPLKKAIADNDGIYAIIKGSAVSHVGAVSGITVPSQVAQADVIQKCYDKYHISPESISYVETHGTGTSLGDPIEIQGLMKAFSKYTNKEAFCSLGSVKSNIGHAESAAGIAGVIKIAMQMQHKTIAKSLYSDHVNKLINFEHTPFYLQTETEPWKLPVSFDENQNVRRAGLTSIGATGVNVHVIFEEYNSLEKTHSDSDSLNTYLFPLSAKNKNRLKNYVEKFVEFLSANKNINLRDLSYTLISGRIPLEERIVFIANNIDSLISYMNNYLAGLDDGRYYCGNIKSSKMDLGLFDISDYNKFFNLWIKEGKLEKIAKGWTLGVDFDISSFISGGYTKQHLPTYPFAKDRYWITEKGAEEKRESRIGEMIHKNVSTIYEQRYESEYSGEEGYLRDHKINGEKIMPAAGYIEMINEAVRNGVPGEETRAIVIKDISWRKPIIGEGKIKVYTKLEAGEEIKVEIYTEEDGEKKINCECKCTFEEKSEEKNEEVIEEKKYVGEECYKIFREMGIEYGETHRGIVEIGEKDGRIISHIKVQGEKEEKIQKYGMYPGVLDSILQSVIGMKTPEEMKSEKSPVVPYRMERVKFIRPLGNDVTAVITKEKEEADGNVKVSIEAYDKEGKISVQISGYETRKIKQRNETIYYVDSWKEAEKEEKEYKEIYTLAIGINEGKKEEIERIVNESIWISNEEEGTVSERYETAAVRIFDQIKGNINVKEKILIQVISGNKVYSGLSGLLKTAQHENSKINWQVIEVSEEESAEEIGRKLKENQKSGSGYIRYNGEKREKHYWKRIEIENKEEGWEDGKVYLITGGNGGLGLKFAKDISEKSQNSRIILCGRRKKGNEEEIEKIRKNGNEIEYCQADVTKYEATERIINEIKEKYGTIDVVLHCAGIIRDGYIRNKSKKEFIEVCEPKIKGTENLDKALRNVKVEKIILFSSIAGALGNPGQADYAAANAFMDQYAIERNSNIGKDGIYGEMISINWPLWADGGMNVDENTAKILKRLIGMKPINFERANQAVHNLIREQIPRSLVIYGDSSITNSKINVVNSSTDDISSNNSREIESKNNDLTLQNSKDQDKSVIVRHKVKELISKVIRTSINDLDNESEFSEFGFDSITFTEFANELNSFFNIDITPALFFEHSNINALALYLVTMHYDRCASAGLFTNDNHNVNSEHPIKTDNQSEKKERRVRPVSSVKEELPYQIPIVNAHSEPIAIVGLSMKFPYADSLQEFWENLVGNRDCISEVPDDRWDWKQYYGDPNEEDNKTLAKWGGFINGVDLFDPEFFKISPKEAIYMDPQQRLLMMYVYMAIADAGYKLEDISGTDMGIFAGTGNCGYSDILNRSGLKLEAYSSTGSQPSMGPNRMSFYLNIHGPSEPIETACSSSLIAIKNAVNSLRNNECSMAAAGGVNTIVTPNGNIMFDKAGMLSREGRCKTFSDKADGYVRGEGVGFLILKRLSDAEKDGDHIYALIRSVTENHGGKANSLVAPNMTAQKELLIKAYEQENIDFSTVTYIEAHGTGTSIGDTIEFNALKEAEKHLLSNENHMFRSSKCGLGSVKSNIGHLELASGIAGIIKVIAQINNKTLVKSIHCENINPYFDFKGSNYYIVQDNQEWNNLIDKEGRIIPLRAGVSSFGFGGVNAHIVLEEYIDERQTDQLIGDNVFVLSARSMEELKEYSKCLSDFVKSMDDLHFTNLAYTLQVGRDEFDYRLAIVARNKEELCHKIAQFNSECDHKLTDIGIYSGKVSKNEFNTEFLNTDSEMANTIDIWLSKKKFDIVIPFWLAGMKVKWSNIYDSMRVKRISLPMFKFRLKRYWASDYVKKSEHSLKECINNTAKSISIESKVELAAHQNSKINLTIPDDKIVEEEKINTPKIRLSDIDREDNSITNQKNEMPVVDLNENYNEKNVILSEVKKSKTFDINELIKDLKKMLSESLYINENDIDIDSNFVDLGLDSVLGVEWISAINKKYDINMNVTVLYDYPTLSDLSNYICSFHLSNTNEEQENVSEEVVIDNKNEVKSNVTISLNKIDKDELMKDLANSLSDVLYTPADSISFEDNFVDIGIDSITGVEWIKTINKKYSIELKVSSLYDYPTLSKLTDYIIGELDKCNSNKDEDLQLREMLNALYEGNLDVDDVTKKYENN